MAIGRTKEEQDLNDLLVKQLVGPEVMEPMEKIGWGHGAPPAPSVGTTPPAEGAQTVAPRTPTQPARDGQPNSNAPVVPTPAAPVAANTPDLLAQMEALRDPTSGLILNKYKDPQEAIKGVGHAVTMAKESFQKRDAAVLEAARLRAENEELRNQRPATPAGTSQSTQITTASRAEFDAAKTKLDTVLSRIAEGDGTLDGENAKALSNAQSELALASARYASAEASHSRNAEAERWNKADRYMQQNHPDSMRFVEEIGVHIDSDPLLQEAVAALVAQGKEERASELAWKSYQKAADISAATSVVADAASKEAQLAAGEQVRQELVEKARRDAGIVSGSAGGQGGHERPQQGMSHEDREALTEAMRREGMTPGTAAGVAFRRQFIPLDPAIFGPN